MYSLNKFSTALSTEGNEHIADDIASGIPCSFKVSSVINPKVPSDPTISFVKSYPAADFFDLSPVLIYFSVC